VNNEGAKGAKTGMAEGGEQRRGKGAKTGMGTEVGMG
jgi:hypothetical protein